MDIEAADLRCCGNCKHGGTKCDENTEEIFYGCSLLTDATHNPLAGEPCGADMVCASWTSDGVDGDTLREAADNWNIENES